MLLSRQIDHASRSGQPLKLLVADDHPIVRSGLVALLLRCRTGAEVFEAADGGQAIDAWARHRPDLTFMDLSMPVVGGLQAIREIRVQDVHARIVVLTAFDGDEDVFTAIAAGARGYLLKDCAPQELAVCMTRVLAGERYLQSAAASRLADRVTVDPLTAREGEVLDQLSRGKCNKLIGRELGITEGTVKIHVKSILSKLDVHGRSEAIGAAHRRGLVHL